MPDESFPWPYPDEWAIGIACASVGLVFGTFALLLYLQRRGQKAYKSFEVKRKISAPISTRPRTDGYELEERKGGRFSNRGVQNGMWTDVPELRY